MEREPNAIQILIPENVEQRILRLDPEDFPSIIGEDGSPLQGEQAREALHEGNRKAFHDFAEQFLQEGISLEHVSHAFIAFLDSLPTK